MQGCIPQPYASWEATCKGSTRSDSICLNYRNNIIGRENRWVAARNLRTAKGREWGGRKGNTREPCALEQLCPDCRWLRTIGQIAKNCRCVQVCAHTQSHRWVHVKRTIWISSVDYTDSGFWGVTVCCSYVGCQHGGGQTKGTWDFPVHFLATSCESIIILEQKVLK